MTLCGGALAKMIYERNKGLKMRCKQDMIEAGETRVPRTCPVHGIQRCRPVAPSIVPGGITNAKLPPRAINSDCLVYLAGPISGLTYDGAEDWRALAKDELANAGIKAVSPLRGKEYLRGIPALTADCAGYGELNCMSSPRGIMTRDRFDAMRCDILLVNLIGAERVSIGTVMEIAWADAKRTPIVVAMEATGNVHEHAMISEAIGFRVTSLMEALHVVKAIADNR
jgi:nucleoside 2-deoxyribosyltransferase